MGSDKHSSSKVIELQNQVLLLSKELDEMKRQYGRFIELYKDQEKRMMQDMQSMRQSCFELAEIVEVIDKLLLSKDVYTQNEFRRLVTESFVVKNNYEKANKEVLDKDDLAFIKFKCVDDDGNVLFEEKEFTRYQIGIGILPFENIISTIKPGNVHLFEVEFATNFMNKRVAGRHCKVEFESEMWLTKKKPSAQTNFVPHVVKEPSPQDRPKTLNDEGELA